MRRRDILGLDAGQYRAHELHGDERTWRETNCAVDFWIELLHCLGRDPVPCLAFTLGTDFDGDQWRMFKFPTADLRLLYGVEVDELNLWKPLEDHVVEQLDLGRLVALDADAWYLPDTAGITYRQVHHKTSVMVQMVDPGDRRLGYFHNAGYFELEGGDYDGLLGRGQLSDPSRLPPYTESIRLDRLASSHLDIDGAVRLARAHLASRPATNPVARLGKRIGEDLDWLAAQGLDTFHLYAFGMLRQCGANAELASSLSGWLGQVTGTVTANATASFLEVSSGMKALELGLSRVARGRSFDPAPLLSRLEASWERAIGELDRRCGH